jgi:type II secretory pathway pseudopilin PulG
MIGPARAVPPYPAAAGFSLLEAVVALAIVGTTSIAALAAFGAELRASARARVALEAQALAEDRLGWVRLLQRDELSPLPDSMARGEFAPPWSDYRWVAEAEPLLDCPDLFEVRVTVTSSETELRLATRLYRPARRVAR